MREKEEKKFDWKNRRRGNSNVFIFDLCPQIMNEYTIVWAIFGITSAHARIYSHTNLRKMCAGN